jgi:DNA-binding PadR family transcriptional regulator
VARPAGPEVVRNVAKRRKVGNLLALALLSLLSQQPMYPYEMAQTLRSRGKDRSIKINWGSLYTVVQNLEKHGFIEAASTEREGRQPERTTYRITEVGKAELADWLRELLSIPEWVPTPFEAALSEATIVGPDDLSDLLTQRLSTLDTENTAHKGMLASLAQIMPRLLLIEAEYQLAMRMAEAGWVRGLLAEMASGSLGDLDMWRRILKTGEMPPELRELDEQARKGWPDIGAE